MSEDDLHVQALSRILLIQNMIFGLPDLETMLGFSARGLEELPGFDRVSYRLGDNGPDTDSTERGTRRIPVKIGSRTYGWILCTVSEDGAFLRYHDYIRNVCFMIAARVDEMSRTLEMTRYRDRLEQEVAAQTAALQEATRRAETERERAELYLATAGTLVIELDLAGSVERINDHAAALLGFRPAEAVGMDWIEMTSPPEEKDGRRRAFHRIISAAEDTESRGDYLILDRDGHRHTIQLHTILRYHQDGTVAGTLSSGIDITERKRAEQEKDVLLKEVYHRTKNNMHVISGMLALQALDIDEPAAHRLLRDAQRRIFSLALVHNMLYTSDNLVQISLIAYVRRLSASVADEHAATSGKRPTLAVSGDDFQIELDTAVPCGLVVNELLAESLIYRRNERQTDGEHPHISIQIHRRNDDIVIRYGDNGRGLADSLKENSMSKLGSRIVHAIIADQLGGTIHVIGEGQPVIEITFPEGARGS